MPGFIIIIFSDFTPNSIAKFFVKFELAITYSILFRTLRTLLFNQDPFL